MVIALEDEVPYWSGDTKVFVGCPKMMVKVVFAQPTAITAFGRMGMSAFMEKFVENKAGYKSECIR